jgi:SAM-dependent methyltransferase
MKKDSTLALNNPEIVNNGYDENDFDEAYWTSPQADGAPPRMYRDSTFLIKYFQDVTSIFRNPICVESVVDIGAGAGNVVNDFRKAGFKISGCEFSSSGRKIAKEHFSVDLDFCDLRGKLPYETNQFDWGMAIGLITMIPKQFLDNAIREIFRVVKLGVIVNVQSFDFHNQELTHNLLHLSGMTTKEWWQTFKNNGIVDLTSIIPPQKQKYGIGITNEFCGLFVKQQNLKKLMGE